LRILIADDGYTLRKIARRHLIAVADLMKLNPSIKEPDQIVGGIPIRLDAMDAAADMNRM
jgi:hypothetical protein